MQVHFANTAGFVFTPGIEPIAVYAIGTVLRGSDAVVIVDRNETDSISQIETSTLVSLLSYLINDTETQPQKEHTESNEAVLFDQPGITATKSADLANKHMLGSDSVSSSAPRIFLPRLNYDMYGEAVAQKEFYKNIPNIVIEPV